MNAVVWQILALAAQRQTEAHNFDAAAHTLRNALDYCPRSLTTATAYGQLLATAFRDFDAA
jgi:hypothetical protein